MRVKAKARENNCNQDQTGSLIEDGQRSLSDSGFKRHRVVFVGDAKRMMILRHPEWVEQLMCLASVRKCKSVMMDSTDLQVRRREFFQVCRGVRSQRALMRNLISPDSGSVVSTCPVDYATSVPTEKVPLQHECGSVLVNHCNITASSVMFFSPTELAAPWTSILRSLTQHVQFCLCTRDDRVHSR